MRRIYINGRFLTQPMTGVERYAYSICKSLVRQGYDFTLVCPKAAIQDCYDTTGMHIVRYGIGNSHFWEQCILPFFFLFKRKFLVFSFTGLGSILVRKKVMTIHDLSFLENPKWFSRAYDTVSRTYLTPHHHSERVFKAGNTTFLSICERG